MSRTCYLDYLDGFWVLSAVVLTRNILYKNIENTEMFQLKNIFILRNLFILHGHVFVMSTARRYR